MKIDPWSAVNLHLLDYIQAGTHTEVVRLKNRHKNVNICAQYGLIRDCKIYYFEVVFSFRMCFAYSAIILTKVSGMCVGSRTL